MKSLSLILITMLQWIPDDDIEEALANVLQRCIEGLREHGSSRKEYILLSLYALDTSFGQIAPS